MLVVEALSAAYGPAPALTDVELGVAAGEVVTLLEMGGEDAGHDVRGAARRRGHDDLHLLAGPPIGLGARGGGQQQGGQRQRGAAGGGHRGGSSGVRCAHHGAGGAAHQFSARGCSGLSSEKGGISTSKASPVAVTTMWYRPRMKPVGVPSGVPEV